MYGHTNIKLSISLFVVFIPNTPFFFYTFLLLLFFWRNESVKEPKKLSIPPPITPNSPPPTHTHKKALTTDFEEAYLYNALTPCFVTHFGVMRLT